MSDNTYGSPNLRFESINDISGKRIKKDASFCNICDYWTTFHDRHKRWFWWYSETLTKRERNIRKKWVKDLPNVDIILDKIERGDQSVRQINFLVEYDAEKYFELLILMNEDLERSHEVSRFKPRRHQKILGKPGKTIRG